MSITVVVRPILEYAWHTGLSKQQTTSLEDIQRLAVQIINDNIRYKEACWLSV